MWATRLVPFRHISRKIKLEGCKKVMGMRPEWPRAGMGFLGRATSSDISVF